MVNIDSFNVDKLKEGEKFIIDTNILYFIHSGVDISNNKKIKTEVKKYSVFINKLLSRGILVSVSFLNLQELFNLIEKKEYEAFCNDKYKCSRKDFRKNVNEREKLMNKNKYIYLQINSLYKIIEETTKQKNIENFLNGLKNHIYDPIDYTVVENNKNIYKNFITADKDFIVDKEINVYTYIAKNRSKE